MFIINIFYRIRVYEMEIGTKLCYLVYSQPPNFIIFLGTSRCLVDKQIDNNVNKNCFRILDSLMQHVSA